MRTRQIITCGVFILFLISFAAILSAQNENDNNTKKVTVNGGGDKGTKDFGTIEPGDTAELIVKTTKCKNIRGGIVKGGNDGWTGGGKGTSITFTFDSTKVDSGKHPGKFSGDVNGCPGGGDGGSGGKNTWNVSATACVNSDKDSNEEFCEEVTFSSETILALAGPTAGSRFAGSGELCYEVQRSTTSVSLTKVELTPSVREQLSPKQIIDLAATLGIPVPGTDFDLSLLSFNFSYDADPNFLGERTPRSGCCPGYEAEVRDFRVDLFLVLSVRLFPIVPVDQLKQEEDRGIIGRENISIMGKCYEK